MRENPSNKLSGFEGPFTGLGESEEAAEGIGLWVSAKVLNASRRKPGHWIIEHDGKKFYRSERMIRAVGPIEAKKDVRVWISRKAYTKMRRSWPAAFPMTATVHPGMPLVGGRPSQSVDTGKRISKGFTGTVPGGRAGIVMDPLQTGYAPGLFRGTVFTGHIFSDCL